MSRLHPRQQSSGFTLVEIAIVLVIVGLLLGGILKGQEIITQARIKNVINDFNGVTAAYFGYQDRYKAVPGDDVNAATRWSTQGAQSGNGDGMIFGAYDQSPPATLPGGGAAGVLSPVSLESLNFWWHLRLAGFVPGATSGSIAAVTQPTNAVGGRVGATTDSTTYGTIGLTGLIVCTNHLPDKIAGAVDSQLDDQIPYTGTVRALMENGPNAQAANGTLPLTAPTGTFPYQETGSLSYVVCRQN
jgi:prepilin-type N-terminal cleavage/methylation domain-containing protein